MRIGYNTWGMPTVPYQTYLPELARMGYTAVTLTVVPNLGVAGKPLANLSDVAALTPEDRRSIKAECERRGLELSGVAGHRPILGDDAATAGLELARLRQTIDFCIDVAPNTQHFVPTMNTGSGGRPGNLEGREQQMIDRLGPLADYARERGVVVCLEPHVASAIDTLQRAEWLVNTLNNPSLKLDFDVSHYEVVGVPMEDSVRRLTPLSGSVEIKDQSFRHLDEPELSGWRVPGNGAATATAPNGRPVEYQFLLGGEGDFDLPRYLRLVHDAGWTGAIGFEASVHCQARPTYDPLAAAQSTYAWMKAAWEQAGISQD